MQKLFETKPWHFLVTALGVAAIFDYLFFEKPIGISFFIFSLLCFGLLWFFWFEKFKQNRRLQVLSLLALLFSAFVFIRANEFLTFLNVLTVIGLGLLTVAELTEQKIHKFIYSDYVLTGVLMPLHFIPKALKAIAKPFEDGAKPSSKSKKVLLGLLMALPLILIFSVLFYSADLAFASLINNLFSFELDSKLFGHLVLISVISFGSVGVLSYIENPKKVTTERDLKESRADQGRLTELTVFLTAIVALFALFILIQLTYFFGGNNNISELGFTYAEYAKRGFVELIFVAGITLTVLLFSENFARTKNSLSSSFLVPSSLLILETLVIIYSAFSRLYIYQQAYGFTTLRFFVSSFIIFLFVLFILLWVKFREKKPDSFFAFATIILVILTLISLNAINPDKQIAKTNLKLYKETGRIDALYLGRLSSDATPYLLSHISSLPLDKEQEILSFINEKRLKYHRQTEFWQGFNLSKYNAYK